MVKTSEGETVYFVHKGCPFGGLSPIEEPDEQIAAVYFPKDDPIPGTIECTACDGIMTQLELERATKLLEGARARNAARREQLGY